MFSQLVSIIDLALQRLLIVLMALLLIDVSWQVLTRFILENPSSFTEELARFLLIWIGLLGSAHAYKHKMHLGVDIFVKSIPSNLALQVQRLVQVITIIFALAVLGFGGIKLMTLAFYLDQTSAAMQLNMGWVYIALPLSGGLLALFACEQLINPNANKSSMDDTNKAINKPHEREGASNENLNTNEGTKA